MPFRLLSKRRAAVAGLIVLQLGVLALVASLTFPLIAGWHQGDLRLYQQAGLRLLQGQLPYRDFPLEYPPASLIPFVLPHLAAWGRRLSLMTYSTYFLVQMGLVSMVVALALAVIVPRGWPGRPATAVLAVYILFVAVGASLLPWRYDLFPAMLTLLALLGVVVNRPTVGGVALGLAVAAKLYPLVLLPVLGLYYLVGRRYRALVNLLLGCGAVVALAALPFLSVAPGTWLPSLGYYDVRGLQIATLPGGVLLLVNALRLTRVRVEFTFGSFHLASPLADAVVAWQPVVLVLAFAAVLVSCWRRFHREQAATGAISAGNLVAALVLVVLVFIVTNKVFSSQHLIWVLPLAPLLRPAPAGLLLAAWALTNVLFWNFEDLTDGRLVPVLLLNGRNLLVLVLIIWLLVEPWSVPVRRLRGTHRSLRWPAADRGARVPS